MYRKQFRETPFCTLIKTLNCCRDVQCGEMDRHGESNRFLLANYRCLNAQIIQNVKSVCLLITSIFI
jgi:hypothetical protein